MVSSARRYNTEKKHWWLTNRKLVYKYIKDARNLIATQDPSEIASALTLLDAALELSPRLELALELKARSLLYLRRFKSVADMLQDYIPSLKMAGEDSGASHSSDNSSRERVKLLSPNNSSSDSLGRDPSFKCFSVSDLKKKIMAGLNKSCEKEGQWRYIVLGQACCHLGLMEDAMALLQTGKRLASAAFRRESICWSDDSFDFSNFPIPTTASSPPSPPRAALTESERITQLLTHIKLMLRRKTAALAALDAGLYSEAIRHFSKILDGRRGAPQGFMAECYMYRATAFRTLVIAESIGDCNRTLALDPTSIQALETRASLLETIRCFTDCLHDLEHLKLLYNSILRDRKLPGPAWKRQNVRYRDIPGKLSALNTKIQELKQRVASGETGNVDYYSLIGLRRGCSRSELERGHLLLSLKHKPDKANSFIERCEFADENDIESIRDRAKMSALLLYRLIQKGYTSVMATIVDEEATEKQRKKAASALEAAQAAIEAQQAAIEKKSETSSKPAPQAAIETQKAATQEVKVNISVKKKSESNKVNERCGGNSMNTCERDNKAPPSSGGAPNPNVYQGVFCRDLAVVGNLLSQVGFNRPLPVKYEALGC